MSYDQWIYNLKCRKSIPQTNEIIGEELSRRIYSLISNYCYENNCDFIEYIKNARNVMDKIEESLGRKIDYKFYCDFKKRLRYNNFEDSINSLKFDLKYRPICEKILGEKFKSSTDWNNFTRYSKENNISIIEYTNDMEYVFDKVNSLTNKNTLTCRETNYVITNHYRNNQHDIDLSIQNYVDRLELFPIYLDITGRKEEDCN